MRICIYLLVFIISLNFVLGDYEKLSQCGKAWAVPNGGKSSDGGQCGLPPPGIGTAALNVFGFNGGNRCGECYELTGPLGSTVVMVTDGCDAGDACKQNKLFNFIISEKDFNKIGNSTAYGNIYSLGYQRVSCGFQGNIKATFGGGKSGGKLDYSYYFTVAFSNYNIGIKQVQLMGLNMPRASILKRDLGKFNWNQGQGGNSYKLQFPATLIVTANDGQVISFKFNRPPAGVSIDTRKQFENKGDPKISKSTCLMAMAPEYVYQESLELGWASYFSWKYTYINISSHETGKKVALKKNCIQTELESYGGLQFTREGGFPTKYIKAVSFTVRAAPPTENLQVYFGLLGSYTVPGPIGWDWEEITIPISKLKPNPIEYNLVFYNNQEEKSALWIDNIKFTYSISTPKQAIVV
ncbi:hypothetical protein DICPUDRAFT_53119 [Dictyostelium purpureum]|uniref:Expansin-like EG45 domain-containing protein n=1 Tax=Dictyostelium purpureum TaxID=5786 RepID=F0ZB85_DICPU|nr:uncharacterized protein DICPUDRAFT_53119 [Dictyostelium purpureum]EGC38797.1 hypothetical protein DICPUDRAFT_53119 [Dictyostelium purpureum]|eukprot:XP_003284691.1 hypothetical protein DICPUDRAFT_53119 [Dictyostelium purpureum]